MSLTINQRAAAPISNDANTPTRYAERFGGVTWQVGFGAISQPLNVVGYAAKKTLDFFVDKVLGTGYGNVALAVTTTSLLGFAAAGEALGLPTGALTNAAFGGMLGAAGSVPFVMSRYGAANGLNGVNTFSYEK